MGLDVAVSSLATSIALDLVPFGATKGGVVADT